MRIGSLLFILFLSSVLRLEAQDIRRVKIAELDQLIRQTEHPVIVNFWATWCKPCVEELPSLIREMKAHKEDSLQLILVSLDDKETFSGKLKDFIRERNYEGRFLWLDETNADLFCPVIDTTWSGAIPATLFLNKKRNYRKFFESKLTDALLVQILKEMFNSLSIKE